MQKRRLLLLFIIFPAISTLTIFFLRDYPNTTKAPKVLAAKTEIIKYISPSIIPITSSPSAIPLRTEPLKIITKKIRPLPNPSRSQTDYILEEINIYRQEKGLSKVTSNTETCNFAQTRAEEISNNFNHDRFNKRVIDKNLPYPSYHEVTENIAYNSDYTDVVKRWIASPGHEENMRKNTPFICIGKHGDYYAFEGWRP